jgi:8-amino-7-oxononanoate synthase
VPEDRVPAYSRFEENIQRRLQDLESAGLRRELRPPCGIDFSSNDYLGLSTHPAVKQRMAETILREGCGAGAARLLRGDRDIFHRTEQRFARLKNSEAALYFSSGYAANIGVLSTFVERHDVVLADEYSHASIVDGIRLSRARRLKFRHCDVDHMIQRLRSVPTGVQKFLITESVFSMDGDIAPLADYAAVCRETGTVLLVDEAHAVGIFGKRGSGVVEQTGTESDVFLTVNPAGKALGAAGAFVAGPAWAVDYLLQRARPFIFSTAPPPALAAAIDESLGLVEREPERRQLLLERSGLFRQLLQDAGFATEKSQSQIIPIVIGDNARACNIAGRLQAAGYDVRALRPPTVPPGTARLRLSVNIHLDPAVLMDFTAELRKAVLSDGAAPMKKDALEAV